MSNPTMPNQRSVGRFSVEIPVSYESFPLTPAVGEITDAAQKMRARMAVRTPGTTKKRAVWIVHGMGQLVPFETLEQLAEGLTSAAAHSSPPVAGSSAQISRGAGGRHGSAEG